MCCGKENATIIPLGYIIRKFMNREIEMSGGLVMNAMQAFRQACLARQSKINLHRE